MSDSQSTPQVVIWNRVYCGALALMYLALMVAGLILVVFHQDLGRNDRQNPPEFWFFLGAALVVMDLPFFLAAAAGAVLPPKPWVWIYHLVIIAIGMTSICTLPFCIPLLIFYLRPETRAYFGYESATNSPVHGL